MNKNRNYHLIAILNLLAAISFLSVGFLQTTPSSEKHPYIWFVIAALFLITFYLNFRKHAASKDEAASQ